MSVTESPFHHALPPVRRLQLDRPWAWLIALLTAIGVATCFLGLIVTFPLVGHATWHAYRETVGR